MLNESDLTFLREVDARERAATKGPWSVDQMTDCFIDPCICEIPGNGCYDYRAIPKNAAFIAHARTDIPRLREIIDRLQKELSERGAE